MSRDEACVKGVAARGGADLAVGPAACADCGTDITARRELVPHALRCTPCQSQIEARAYLGRGA